MCFDDDKKGLFVNIERFEKKYNIKVRKPRFPTHTFLSEET